MQPEKVKNTPGWQAWFFFLSLSLHITGFFCWGVDTLPAKIHENLPMRFSRHVAVQTNLTTLLHNWRVLNVLRLNHDERDRNSEIIPKFSHPHHI